MASSDSQPIRILLLHGWCQDAEKFRAKSGAFRKLLPKQTECVFVDSPFQEQNVPAPWKASGAPDSSYRTWFHPTEGRMIYNQWQDGLRHALTALRDQGPFDLVLGFSQGTIIATLIAALHSNNLGDSKYLSDYAATLGDLALHKPLRGVVCVGGLKPRATDLSDAINHFGGGIDFPSLHIYGMKDELVSPEMSELLFQCYHATNRHRIMHSSGHVMPGTPSEVKEPLLEFLRTYCGPKPMHHEQDERQAFLS